MDSDKSGQGKKPSIADLIDSIQENAKSVSTNTEIASLTDRIDALELLVEEYGQARHLQQELREYVSDLRGEVGDIRNYRFWVTAFAWLLSVGMFFLLFLLIVSSPVWFSKMDDHLQAPLFIALITGAVVLMVILLKGVYRSRQERNHGEVLPEAVKVALETFRDSI